MEMLAHAIHSMVHTVLPTRYSTSLRERGAGADVLHSMAQFGNEEQHEAPELIPYQPDWHFRTRQSRLLRWLYEETKFKSTTWHEWFTTNLYDKVKDIVLLNSPVVKIDYQPDDHVKLTLKDGSVQSADRVICTVPLAVLKDDLIDFSPPLPAPVRASIEAIDMPPSFRILFQMKERFYNDLTSLGTMMNMVRNADDLTFVYDPLLGKDIKNLHVIAYVAIGRENSGEMSQLSDEDLSKAALKKIDQIYGGKGSLNLIGSPVVQNWTSVEYIRGA